MRQTWMGITLVSLLAVTVTGRAATDLSQFKTADALWMHIDKLQEGPTERPQSMEEAQKLIAGFLSEMEAACQEFRKLYPADARRWDAQMMLVQVAAMRAQTSGHKVELSQLQPQLEEVVAAKDASPMAKTMAKNVLIELHGEAGTDESAAALKKLADDPDPRVSQMAKSQLDRVALRKKPLELSFTALDGSKVDVATMRGKVVLVDFWATWCGPCRQDLPNVIAAYKKYHDKGFEIIGISLDQEKAKLEGFVKDKGLAWPQYFDGKGWESTLGQRFGVTQIPTQWLVDKKGFIRSMEVRGSLDEQVGKLLAE